MAEMRLQKFMAESGIASRRKAEEIIKAGRVRVNGALVTEMGMKVTENDAIEVDGKPVTVEEKKVYIVLNKPTGYVTTVKDQFGRKNVIDLINGVKKRIYPVGRLDYDTSGLLILTNDGEFTYKLTHPKHEMNKTYAAEVKGIPDSNDIDQFKKGVQIDNYITAPASLKILRKEGTNSVVEITIHEGKNRQVRKMCDSIGHPVLKLKRVAIGNLKLEGLIEGQWRYLTSEEVKKLVAETSN